MHREQSDHLQQRAEHEQQQQAQRDHQADEA
jgi:hypothetical protein